MLKPFKTVVFTLFVMFLGTNSDAQEAYLASKCSSDISQNNPITKTRNKIIHISDIHVGYDYNDDLFSEIIETINLNYKHVADESIVLITGDLIDKAAKIKRGNVKNYYEYSFKAIDKKLDILRKNGFCVMVTPGNHDVKVDDKDYRGDYYNSKENYLLVAAEKKFKEVFYKTRGNAISTFPSLDIFGSVAYIGINSISSSAPAIKEKEFSALGYSLYYNEKDDIYFRLGKEQLDRLETLVTSIEKGDYKGVGNVVLYMHHIEKASRSEDYKRFFHIMGKLKKTNVVALFAGHKHEFKTDKEHWNKVVPTFTVGSATATCKKEEAKCDSYSLFVEFLENGKINKVEQVGKLTK